MLSLTLSHVGIAEEIAVKDERYSPFLGQDFPQQVWWGDTHVHTQERPYTSPIWVTPE